jgi:hypothetical protein
MSVTGLNRPNTGKYVDDIIWNLTVCCVLEHGGPRGLQKSHSMWPVYNAQDLLQVQYFAKAQAIVMHLLFTVHCQLIKLYINYYFYIASLIQ